jgi:hypothetical protein
MSVVDTVAAVMILEAGSKNSKLDLGGGDGGE